MRIARAAHDRAVRRGGRARIERRRGARPAGRVEPESSEVAPTERTARVARGEQRPVVELP
ncbi:MAG TPA: hypothetical protein VK592_04695, partial [Candidatus Dormibacteraeota bacterium]|nr:hypothetical protein [Candidatus Dormibacteraeota bacterium]